ncbi:MAG TPA: S16 family serine protease [Candidatus Lumbricidophila sp.]|nr:S16 family serine protease [Candidatus Lumbricidophila sp.]
MSLFDDASHGPGAANPDAPRRADHHGTPDAPLRPRFEVDPSAAGKRFRRRRVRPRTVVSWAIAVLLIGGTIFGLAPSPYVIEKPGPVFDTLGTAEHDGAAVPLIDIPGQQTYPTSGELNLLTVSITGTAKRAANWLDVLQAWLDPSRSVVPHDEFFPPNVTPQEQQQQSAADMTDSKQDAVAAALVELGYDVGRDVKVASIAQGLPADGVLKVGDTVKAVNGTAVHSYRELRAAVQATKGQASKFDIIRDGSPLTVTLTPTFTQDAYLIGAGARMAYTVPFAVNLQLDNVGGPSAGMMFALGIIDKLTPGAATGGQVFAGTGTIDATGVVGPIGGIREKLWGAQRAGAKWFLAPTSNCDDVVGQIPDGLTVFAVDSLHQAREIVETIGAGGDTSKFEGCPAPH